MKLRILASAIAALLACSVTAALAADKMDKMHGKAMMGHPPMMRHHHMRAHRGMMGHHQMPMGHGMKMDHGKMMGGEKKHM